MVWGKGNAHFGAETSIKRKNTIAITSLNGSLSFEDLEAILHGCLSIKDEDLYGIQTVSREKILVKLTYESVYNGVCSNYENKEMVLDGGNIRFKVSDASGSKTFVSIRNAPFEMSDDEITKILSNYGEVLGIRQCVFGSSRYKGKFNGLRTAIMKKRKDIPSSVYYKGQYLAFWHSGQTQTCRKCGLEGHYAVNCQTPQYEKVNVLSEVDYPSLPTKHPIGAGVTPEEKQREGESEESDDVATEERQLEMKEREKLRSEDQTDDDLVIVDQGKGQMVMEKNKDGKE